MGSRRVIVLGLTSLIASACVGRTDASSPADFCNALDNGALCDASRCSEVIAAELNMDPRCEYLLDLTLDCVAELTLSCTTSISYQQVIANGDRSLYEYSLVGGSYQLQIDDLTCARIAQGFNGCRTCPDAPGARSTTSHGVGEPCTSSSQCAVGTCSEGVCLVRCTSDDECVDTRLCTGTACYDGGCRPYCTTSDDCPYRGMTCDGYDEVRGESYCVP